MPRRDRLNRTKVVTAALEIADRDGIETLTMRKLATNLGVEPMSLYNHVANKNDLLDAVAELVFSQVKQVSRDEPWIDRLRATAVNLYTAFAAHPTVGKAVVDDLANPTSEQALRSTEDLLAALFDAGFDAQAARRNLIAINGLVFGTLALSTSGFATSPPARGSELDGFHRVPDPARLPNYARAAAAPLQTSALEDFTYGLNNLLSGIERDASSTNRAHGESDSSL